MKMKKYSSVDDYLDDLRPDFKAALTRLRNLIQKSAPEAQESISYGMPGYKYLGRPLVYFAAFQKHCSFFGGGKSAVTHFAADLKDFKTGPGTIQFTPLKPLPAALVQKIVKLRIKENEQRAQAGKRT